MTHPAATSQKCSQSLGKLWPGHPTTAMRTQRELLRTPVCTPHKEAQCKRAAPTSAVPHKCSARAPVRRTQCVAQTQMLRRRWPKRTTTLGRAPQRRELRVEQRAARMAAASVARSHRETGVGSPEEIVQELLLSERRHAQARDRMSHPQRWNGPPPRSNGPSPSWQVSMKGRSESSS